MKFSLVVISGSTTGKEIPIRIPEFVIGRDPECHLRPASPMISKKHCAFVLEGERVLFKDFGSTNGSFINDVRVEQNTYLQDGDVVKFGPLTFRTKMQATSVMMAAAPTVVPATASTLLETASPRTTASSSNAVRKAHSAEDDIAAMLFNFADAPSGSIPADEIPMGSTVAGLSVDPTTEDQPALGDDQRRTDQKKAAAKSVASSANTQSAAEAILQKYMKRPRA